MQSLEWYFHRVRGMSGREIAWRVSMLMQDMVDRVRIPIGAYPKASGHVPGDSLEDLARGFSFTCESSTEAYPDAWRERLVASAEQVADHRLSYFNLDRQFLGNPINWHRDHNSDVDTQRGQIQNIDYRDFRTNGDCKHVWEPNRHHQFVILARAYRATDERRYAVALAEQFNGWIEQNPFGYGMNWRSPLELGVRLINWVWALELVRPSGCISGEVWQKVYRNAYLLCWDIQRKYSRGSSANNHLVGEAAGVFIASCYFGDFPERNSWIKESQTILINEIEAQTYPDGCTREQALGYQFFVIQFYLYCGLIGKWSGHEFPAEYWSRLRSLIGFVANMAEAGPLPLFGDQDDGYVLDLGDEARDVDALQCLASQIPELGIDCHTDWQSEAAYWSFGSRKDTQASPARNGRLASAAFSDSGYYLLQSDSQGRRISVLFDCAELGYGGIAAHGHADALSFSLRAFGEYLLVDTGTYDYFTMPEMRNYFRSTAAHNTIAIDGQNQSELLGPFLWGRRANATCLEWEDTDLFTRISAEHDGYQALPDPVMHKRTITLQHREQRCEIEDMLMMAGRHTAEVFFHLGPECVVISSDANTLTVRVRGRHEFKIVLDERLVIRMVRGSEDPICGWYSSGYHQKVAITTIIGECSLSETTTLHHSIQFEESK